MKSLSVFLLIALMALAPCCAKAQYISTYTPTPVSYPVTTTTKVQTYQKQINGNYDILQNNQYNQQIKIGEVRQTLNNSLDVFSGTNSYNLIQTHTITPNLGGGYDVYKYNSMALPVFENTLLKAVQTQQTMPTPKIDYNRNALKMLRLDR